MTSSRRDAGLRGVQTPRVGLSPRAQRSDGDDAAFLCSKYGLTPDEWQLSVLRSWLGFRADGKWAALRCGLAVPRQNGKNGVLEMRELFGMIVLGEKFLHTAHEVKTARKAFMRLSSFFENERVYPELAGLVEEVRRTNGQEAIVLRNGGSCEFIARSKGSGRGYTVDALVMDEAQELSEEALEALLPTISAAPLGNSQQILTGTPPGPKASGEIFTRVRTDGLEGKDKRLSWHEWSCEPDADLDDEVNWLAANPALGIRLQWDIAHAERGSLSDAGFGRERLGMWDEASSNRVIDARTWAACADTAGQIAGPIAIAVDVMPDRSVGSLSVAGQRPDGLWQVELVDNRNSVGWIVERVAGIVSRRDVRAVVIDGQSPAASLIDALRVKGVVVTTTHAGQMAQACGMFYDAVIENQLRHLDVPLLNSALGVARKRALRDAWAWHRKNATSDITPLVSATLALWGAQSESVERAKQPSKVYAF